MSTSTTRRCLAALPLHHRAASCWPLAVSSPTRAPTLPDVPTTLEAGYPNSAYRFWIGVFAPAKTPPAIVNKLNAEIQKALQVPAVRAKLAKLGVQPMAMNAGEFDKFVKEELAINSELVKAAGIVSRYVARPSGPAGKLISFAPADLTS